MNAEPATPVVLISSAWLALGVCAVARLALLLPPQLRVRPKRPGLGRDLLLALAATSSLVLVALAIAGTVLALLAPASSVTLVAGALGRCTALAATALTLEWWASSQLPHAHRWPWCGLAVAECTLPLVGLKWLHGLPLIFLGLLVGALAAMALVLRFAFLHRSAAKIVVGTALAFALLASTATVAQKVRGGELGIVLGVAAYVGAVSVTATLAELDVLPRRPRWLPDTSAHRPSMSIIAAGIGAVVGVMVTEREAALLFAMALALLGAMFAMRARVDLARSPGGREPPCWAVRWFAATTRVGSDAATVRFSGTLEQVVNALFHTVSGIPVERPVLEQVVELHCHHAQRLVLERATGGVLRIDLAPDPRPERGAEQVLVAQWCGHGGQPGPVVLPVSDIDERAIAQLFARLPKHAPRRSRDVAAALIAELGNPPAKAVKLVLPVMEGRLVARSALLVAVLPHWPCGSARVPGTPYRVTWEV